MREIVNIQLGQCGNQIGEKVGDRFLLQFFITIGDYKMQYANVHNTIET